LKLRIGEAMELNFPAGHASDFAVVRRAGHQWRIE
jgi:hypothetical protein